MTPEHTCSATLMRFVSVDWHKSCLNGKNKYLWILSIWCPNKKFQYFWSISQS